MFDIDTLHYPTKGSAVLKFSSGDEIFARNHWAFTSFQLIPPNKIRHGAFNEGRMLVLNKVVLDIEDTQFNAATCDAITFLRYMRNVLDFVLNPNTQGFVAAPPEMLGELRAFDMKSVENPAVHR